jgi:glycosyltransferase involved in cell wall biosynthesis
VNGKIKLVLVDQAVAFGGSIVVLAHLLKFIDHDLYECVLVTAMPQDVLNTLFDSRVRIVRLKPALDYRDRGTWSQKLGWLGKNRQRAAGYLFTVLSLAGNLRYSWEFWRILRRERPQIVHINNNCYFSPQVCALAGQRYVYHYHGILDIPLPRWHRWVLSKASRFISISHYVTRIHERRKDPRFQPVETILNPAPKPVDLTREQREEVKLRWIHNRDSVVIGIFGRLVGWKGQMEFLHAFQAVRQRFPDVKALIVGDASDLGKQYETELREWVSSNGLQDAVVFTGYISDPGPLYQICDIVVHASIEPEPFGLVIVEAMSAGAATIASSLGAAPEIVTHGVTGLIADPRSPTELTEAMARLVENPELRTKLASAGKTHARHVYAPERFAAAVEGVYRGVISSPAREVTSSS